MNVQNAQGNILKFLSVVRDKGEGGFVTFGGVCWLRMHHLSVLHIGLIGHYAALLVIGCIGT